MLLCSAALLLPSELGGKVSSVQLLPVSCTLLRGYQQMRVKVCSIQVCTNTLRRNDISSDVIISLGRVITKYTTGKNIIHVWKDGYPSQEPEQIHPESDCKGLS